MRIIVSLLMLLAIVSGNVYAQEVGLTGAEKKLFRKDWTV